MNKKVEEWLNIHCGEDYCMFCIYDDECPHDTACYGGMPIEPPCFNGLEKCLDFEEILEFIENGGDNR